MVVVEPVVLLLDDTCQRQMISSVLLDEVLFDHQDGQAEVI